jgi:enterochelin esterase-like enzyme
MEKTVNQNYKENTMGKVLFARPAAILAVLLVVSMFLGGCSSNQPIDASSPGLNQAIDAPPPGFVLESMAFTFMSDITYTAYNGQPLKLDLYQENKASDNQPVIIWLPEYGKEEYVADYSQFQEISGVEDKFPTPVAFYMGYHYTVVSVQYADSSSKTEDLNRALDYLTDNAKTLNIDASNIGVLQATESGYAAMIMKQSKETEEANNPLAIEESGGDFTKLQSAENTKVIVSFFDNGLGGGPYDAGFDPIALLNDPEDSSWVDPITNTYPGTAYRIFPTPARGINTMGSYMIYLPNDYYASNKRYPVLYYLHGGNGSQREASWLINIMDAAMKAGKMPETIIVGVQALPEGWYANANVGAPGVTSGPIEDVIIKDLIPHIDATYRTVDNPKGRGIEGWSAGGFGTMRLALKYPELFGVASSLSGSIIDWQDEHNVQFLTCAFGPNEPDSIAYFNAIRPQAYVQKNAAAIKENVTIRLIVGDEDWLYNNDGNYITKNFSDLLTSLGIPHEYSVVNGADHMITEAYAAGTFAYPLEFWQKAFDPFK